MTSQVERFRALHALGKPLILPNAWDALSARIVESAGAQAVATSSAGVAWARGYRDGEQLPLDELVAVVRGIARNVQVPLSVDLERGYGESPAQVAESVAQIVAAGAVGVNLEDASAPPELLAEKVRAVRARLGVSAFVNARTCIVLHRRVESARLVDEVLARAHVLAEAGADCLFVPGLVDPTMIGAIARGTALPLNVMLAPGLAPLPQLAELGVRRLSTGPRLVELAYGAARQATRALLERSDATQLLGGDLSYQDAQKLFAWP